MMNTMQKRSFLQYRFNKMLGILLLIVTWPVSVPYLLLAKNQKAAAWMVILAEAVFVVLFVELGYLTRFYT